MGRSHTRRGPTAVLRAPGNGAFLVVQKQPSVYAKGEPDGVTAAARYRAPRAKLPSGRRLDSRNFAAPLFEVWNRQRAEQT